MIPLTEKLDTQEPQATLLPGGRRSYMNKRNRSLARIGFTRMGYDYFNDCGDDENPYILEYKASDVAMGIVLRKMLDNNQISTEKLNHLYSARENMHEKIRAMIEEAVAALAEPELVKPLHRRILQWAGSLFKRKRSEVPENSIASEPAGSEAEEVASANDQAPIGELVGH